MKPEHVGTEDSAGLSLGDSQERLSEQAREAVDTLRSVISLSTSNQHGHAALDSLARHLTEAERENVALRAFIASHGLTQTWITSSYAEAPDTGGSEECGQK